MAVSSTPRRRAAISTSGSWTRADRTASSSRVRLKTTCCRWSRPTGTSIVFVSERDGTRTLFRMGADGSSPTKLGAGRVAYRPVMSFDGQWVYYSGPEQQNFRIPVAGGTPEPLLAELTAGGRKLPPAFHEPMPSPDGRAVAGHYQDPKTSGERIAVLSMDAATPERLFPGRRRQRAMGPGRQEPAVRPPGQPASAADRVAGRPSNSPGSRATTSSSSPCRPTRSDGRSCAATSPRTSC